MKIKMYIPRPFFFPVVFLSLLPFIAAINLYAEPLFSYEENNFSIQIKEDYHSPSESLTLEIRNSDLAGPEIEQISDPDRIVIDLPGIQLQENKNFKTGQITLLKSIRTGNHPDRLRIVLDLSDKHQTQHSWSVEQGYLVIVLTTDNTRPLSSPPSTIEPASTKEKESPTPEPTIAEISPEAFQLEKELSTKSTLQMPVEDLKPLPPEVEEPTESPTAVTEISSKPISTVPPVPEKSLPLEPLPVQDGKLTMQRILYDYQGKERTPVLKVVTSKPTGFTLIKKSDSLYKLDLPKCNLEYEYLTLPHYPPFDFIGFTLIKVEEQTGGNLAVMIGVDQGTKIKAYRTKNEIWIRAVK